MTEEAPPIESNSTGSEPTGPEPGDNPVADDPVAKAILTLIAALAPGKSIIPEDAARAFAQARAKPKDPPDLWRRYLAAVRQQALHLARQGRIVILRKGKVADPNAPIKGVIRLGPVAGPVAGD